METKQKKATVTCPVCGRRFELIFELIHDSQANKKHQSSRRVPKLRVLRK